MSLKYFITGTAALACPRASAAQYMDFSVQELFLLYLASLPHTEVNGISETCEHKRLLVIVRNINTENFHLNLHIENFPFS